MMQRQKPQKSVSSTKPFSAWAIFAYSLNSRPDSLYPLFLIAYISGIWQPRDNVQFCSWQISARITFEWRKVITIIFISYSNSDNWFSQGKKTCVRITRPCGREKCWFPNNQHVLEKPLMLAHGYRFVTSLVKVAKYKAAYRPWT